MAVAEDDLIQSAIYRALCACLNLDPSSEAAKAMVILAYQDEEGNPSPPRRRDVVYYTMLKGDEGNDGKQVYGSISQTSGTQRPSVISYLSYQLIVTCYGTNAEKNAHRIRSFIFLDGQNFPRKILRDYGIYLVYPAPQPFVGHEQDGALWRRRVDLIVDMKVRDEIIYGPMRGTVLEAPRIIQYGNN